MSVGESTTSDVLSTAVEYSRAAEHSLHGEFEWESDYSGHPCVGYKLTTALNSLRYRAYAPRTGDYLMVTSDIDFISAIQQEMGEDDVERFVDMPVAYSRDDTEEVPGYVAARAVLDSVDGEEMEEAIEKVSEVADTADARAEYQWTKNESLRRILVHRKLLPVDGLDSDEYLDAVRTTTTQRTNALVAFFETIDLPDFNVDEEEIGGDQGEFGSGRAFQ